MNSGVRQWASFDFGKWLVPMIILSGVDVYAVIQVQTAGRKSCQHTEPETVQGCLCSHESLRSSCYTRHNMKPIRLTLLLLLVSTLGYTNAWAFEGLWQHDAPEHAGETDHAPGSAMAGHGEPLPEGELAGHGCDHCCHASAHIVGMVSAQGQHAMVTSHRIVMAAAAQAVSYISAQDSPPPKS